MRPRSRATRVSSPTLAQAKLAHQVAAVLLDRLRTDVEKLCRTAVGTTFGDQLQDAALAHRELLPGRNRTRCRAALQERVDQLSGNIRTEELLAGHHAAQRSQEFLVGDVLHHIAVDAGAQRLVHVFLGLERGQRDDADVRQALLDLRRGLDAGHEWQREIHQDQIRLQRHRLTDRLLAVLRFGDDVEVGQCCHHRSQALAQQVMIFHDQNAVLHWLLSNVERAFHRPTCPSGERGAGGPERPGTWNTNLHCL